MSDAHGRRWDIDERGRGVASGAAFAPNVDELATAIADDGWVAEDAAAHLMPHIQSACDAPGSRLRVASSEERGSTLVVDLAWAGPAPPGADDVRAEVVRVVGSFAEHTTHVRQRSEPDAIAFEILTGTTADESPYVPHGHLVTMRVGRRH